MSKTLAQYKAEEKARLARKESLDTGLERFLSAVMYIFLYTISFVVMATGILVIFRFPLVGITTLFVGLLVNMSSAYNYLKMFEKKEKKE